MEIWHVWIIAAIILFIAEIFTPGFLLACLGIACLFSGFVAYYELGLKIQILTFSISALVVFIGVRPLFMKYFYSTSDKIKTNVDALIGKTGMVSEKIDPNTNKGRVLVNGEDWRGVSIDDTEIEVGEKISVVRVDGTKLIVKQALERKGD